jgi:hypothetical protein
VRARSVRDWARLVACSRSKTSIAREFTGRPCSVMSRSGVAQATRWATSEK